MNDDQTQSSMGNIKNPSGDKIETICEAKWPSPHDKPLEQQNCLEQQNWFTISSLNPKNL